MKTTISAWSPRNLYGLVALALAVGAGFIAMGSFATVQEAAKAEMTLSDLALSMASGEVCQMVDRCWRLFLLQRHFRLLQGVPCRIQILGRSLLGQRVRG